MKKENGFTLIELIVALAIFTILVSMAVPNFNILVKNSRLNTQVNTFVAALNIARSEAAKRNLNVILCPSSDGASCAADERWEQGWIVYVDTNNLDGAGVKPIDRILHVFPALHSINTLRATANYKASITYVPRGFTTQAGALILCDDRTGSYSQGDNDVNDPEDFAQARAITISTTGRPSVGDAAPPTFVNCTP